MKQAIITLKYGRIFKYESQYMWGYEEKLNDSRTPFIEIGNYIFRKDEISTIEILELNEEEEGEKENGTN